MGGRDSLELHESVPLVYGGADPKPTWAAGFDGRGSTVAIVDSGVDGTHPDLRDRVVANVKVDDPNQLFGAGSPVYTECPVACSTELTGGHGTHVAGIVAGDGTASDGYYRGVAPGASIVGLSVGEGPAIFFELAAYDWILVHRAKLNIVAVNNSFGPDAGTRFDYTAPTNVATRALNDAGVVVVFSAGNSGTGSRTDPEGASDCGADGAGTCQINAYSVAPWVISVANGRKDSPGGPGAQPLSFSSSRGDPVPQKSVDGRPIDYLPTITAPGTNIRSARAVGGTTTPLSCGSAEPPACVPPPEAVQYEPSYMVLSGTSMAAPHVSGAIAVIQTAARARLGRQLTPGEVRSVLTSSADPMTTNDGLWVWPCGSAGLFQPCGDHIAGTTGKPYERWQVGAGYLDVAAALRAVDAMRPPAGEPAPPTPPAPGGPAPTTPAPGGNSPSKADRRRAALKRCYKRAAKAKRRTRAATHRARVKAHARCKARYG
jgi:serine protease AprX